MDWDDKTKDTSLKFFIKGMKVLWWLVGLGKQRKKLILTMGWIALIVVLCLMFPFFVKLLIDEIKVITETKTISNYLILIICGILFFKALATYLNRFIKEIKLLDGIIVLENFWPVIIQEKLLALSTGYHEKENTGRKIAKIEKGCNKTLDIMCHLFWNFIPQALYLTINIIFILFMDWRLGILFFLPFGPAIWANLKCYNNFIDSWEEWDKQREKSSGFFCQSLINVHTVQGFAQEDKEKKRFGAIRSDMEMLDKRITFKMQKYFFWAEIMLNFCFATTILVGIYLVCTGQGSLGTVVYIIATGSTTMENIWSLSHTYTRIMRNLVSVIRLRDLIEEEVEIKNALNAVIPNNFSGQFDLESVNFSYPGKDKAVFEDFDLSLKPNQMTAFVGKSGEGKTTIVRLLCRAYDIDGGQIKLDGKDIRDLDLYWYRRLFAIVHQDVELFDTTIADNIRYGCPEASDEDVAEAIKAAHLNIALSNVDRFPEGMKTQVGERGVKLSGGERQRVGIARAYLSLLYGAKVLILDEATSSLDSEAEKAIQEMLEELRQRQSVAIIAIAHRLSTIQKADMIYVIGDGKIVEQGDHDKLVRHNGLYAALASLQKLGEVDES